MRTRARLRGPASSLRSADAVGGAEHVTALSASASSPVRTDSAEPPRKFPVRKTSFSSLSAFRLCVSGGSCHFLRPPDSDCCVTVGSLGTWASQPRAHLHAPVPGGQPDPLHLLTRAAVQHLLHRDEAVSPRAERGQARTPRARQGPCRVHAGRTDWRCGLRPGRRSQPWPPSPSARGLGWSLG